MTKCKNCGINAIPLYEPNGYCYACEIECRKDAETEIERLHKQDGNGTAPRYFWEDQ